MVPSPTSWTPLLMHTGQRCLVDLLPLVDRADPNGTITPRSRLLCAALSQLALEVFDALGGENGEDVATAAAELALLTKLDDQVIDALPFHGGATTDREAVARRTRAYLDPTLESIRRGSPVNDEARCDLAADLGRRLDQLALGSDRLPALLDLIARGWAIQVNAVTVLTAHPSAVSTSRVARTSADISGAWLLMVAMVGTLPHRVRRAMTRDECRAFFDYGLHIQRADALADLCKDLAEGLINTNPSRLVWERAPAAYEDALAREDTEAVYHLYRGTGADVDVLPASDALDALDVRLAELGRLPQLLRWIHGFLTWRYVSHPLSRRSAADPAFAPWLAGDPSWTDYMDRGISDDPDAQEGQTPCSVP